ncbi:MAG: C39 family peptidase [Desulfuromonadales bacterium]|nr:C39 family peptidase [Desulfuromonadales bacterium]
MRRQTTTKRKKIALMKSQTILTVFFAALLTLVQMEIPLASDLTLAVPERIQEHSQWCWAGSSQSVLDYFRTRVEQCAMANYAFNRSDCCGNTDFNWTNTNCNNWNFMWGNSSNNTAGGSLQGILGHWGVTSSTLAAYLTQQAGVAELNSGRPFVMRFGWTEGGGHFLIGYGYRENGTYLQYMDPWPGNGYTESLYSWVMQASDHTWTHTLSNVVQTCTNGSSLAPAATDFNAGGGTGTFNVTVQTGCPWAAGESLDWVTITSGSGNGNGTVTYSVSPNLTNALRSGTIFVAGRLFTVRQSPDFVINATLIGTGSGTVTSAPAGISCTSGTCSGNFSRGTSVTLTPTASVSSSFSGWSGDCGGSGNCILSMTKDWNSTATFTLHDYARIGSSTTPYGTLNSAYTATQANDIIKTRGISFIENLFMNRGVAISILGGYASGFGSRSGYTNMGGVLTIASGRLTVEQLVIQ